MVEFIYWFVLGCAIMGIVLVALPIAIFNIITAIFYVVDRIRDAIKNKG